MAAQRAREAGRGAGPALRRIGLVSIAIWLLAWELARTTSSTSFSLREHSAPSEVLWALADFLQTPSSRRRQQQRAADLHRLQLSRLPGRHARPADRSVSAGRAVTVASAEVILPIRPWPGLPICHLAVRVGEQSMVFITLSGLFPDLAQHRARRSRRSSAVVSPRSAWEQDARRVSRGSFCPCDAVA